MTKADLLAPRAKLDWANNQLIVLNAELTMFRESKPYKIVSKPSPDGNGVLLYLEMTGKLPPLTAMHIGAILAAQRDSLDFLVTALAEKNGAKEPRDCYFPIADSEQRFLENGTQKKIKRLSPEDRAIINSIKPYRGWEPPLVCPQLALPKG